MTKKVRAAEAKAKLSALVAEVAYGGEHIVIERRGKPLAALVNMDELKYLEQGRAISPHPRGALSLIGIWKDIPEEELDKVVSDIYQAREQDKGRKVALEG